MRFVSLAAPKRRRTFGSIASPPRFMDGSKAFGLCGLFPMRRRRGIVGGGVAGSSKTRRKRGKHVEGRVSAFAVTAAVLNSQVGFRSAGFAIERVFEYGRDSGNRPDLGKPMWIRHVLIPGWTDDPVDLHRLADRLLTLGPAVERVDVLPYHTLGLAKWGALGRVSKLADTLPPTSESLATAVALLRSRGLPAV